VTEETPRALSEQVDRPTWMPGSTKLRYGGDYNPEQWDRATWLEDIELMHRAGINLVSVGIFSWGLLEPREGEYDFSFLDDILGLLHEAGIDVDLGTPTAAPPAWFWKKYPQARVVTREGLALRHGSRGMGSPSSPEYRRAAAGITSALAERYRDHPALVMWHVHNEYGAPVSECYSEQSVLAFREWLRRRYGSLEGLNAAWGTTFWSQQYGEWDEVDAPRVSASVVNPAQRLDFKRFSSDALLECFVLERDILRAATPHLPVTTNFMATNCPSVDYWKWAREVDVVANDYYLVAEREDNHILAAMDSDFTRSLAGNRPWMLMEHSTSAVNWQPRNIAKRPGELARNSLSSVARGSDAVLFFQFRASRYGAEKFHSAMLPHAGVTSRVWREVEELGSVLQSIEEVRGSRVNARVALLWDIESFWAQDLEWRPSAELDHRERIEAYYSALWKRGVTVDFAHPSADLSGYDLVVAPALYLVDGQSTINLENYVAAGGNLVVSYFSGIVDENDSVPAGAFPGALRTVLGLSIEEFLPFREHETARLSSGATARSWADDIVLGTAEAEVTHLDGRAAGLPAVTRNAHGAGTAWYVATKLLGDDLGAFLDTVLERTGVAVAPAPAPGLEVVRRESAEADYTFLLNHSDREVPHHVAGTDLITGQTVASADVVPAGAVRILRTPRARPAD
jgi:beta-galactosidase